MDCLLCKWPVTGAQTESLKQKAKDKYVSHKCQREQGTDQFVLVSLPTMHPEDRVRQ